MRYHLNNIFINSLLLILTTLFTTVHANAKEIIMNTNELLTISVSCKDNPQCIYNKQRELFITIKITNNSEKNIELPLEFIKKTGPAISLKDNHSDLEAPLRTNLADRELMKSLTAIPAKQSVSFDWVIFDSELEQFSHKGSIDVLAIITIYTNIYIKGNKDPIVFDGKANLPIKTN